MVISNHFLVDIWFIIIIQFDSQPFYKCLALGLPGMSFLSSKISPSIWAWHPQLLFGLTLHDLLHVLQKTVNFQVIQAVPFSSPKVGGRLTTFERVTWTHQQNCEDPSIFWSKIALKVVFVLSSCPPKTNLKRFCLMNFFRLSLKNPSFFFWCLGKKNPWIFLHVPPPQIAKPGFAAPLVVALPGGSKVVEKTT